MVRRRWTSTINVITWGGPLTSSMWLFFLIPPMQTLFQSHQSDSTIALFLAQLAVIVILYLSLVLKNTYSGADPYPTHLRRYLIILFVMAVLSVLGPLMGGIQWLPSMIYTSAAAGCKLPTKWAMRTIAVLVFLTILLGFVLNAPWVAKGQAVVLVGGIGLITTGVTRLVITIRALEEAREEVARLAVSDERLRMARDLHDLLGHSLSLIAVKSELAKHLVRPDPDQAIDEISDIERVTRTALADVRTAVSGYRKLSIVRELASSKQILAAANIEADIRVTSTDFPLESESLFAWTIREGVTNVVRHSKASRCSISIVKSPLGLCCEIENDDMQGREAGFTERYCPYGNGLTGLLERVAACNGRMEARPSPDGGFRLAVILPNAPDPTHRIQHPKGVELNL